MYGVLIEVSPPFSGVTLPPTDVPFKVGCLDFVLPEASNCGDCFSIDFKDGINGIGQEVAIFNIVSVENRSYIAGRVDCEKCATQVLIPQFIRGDCNFDGEIDIADPAETIAAIFGVGDWRPIPPCLDACDFNDDDRLDLADGIGMLR